VAIPVKPNVPVKANDVLFQIDPAPFQYKVAQLQASLAGAKQQVEILKSNCEQRLPLRIEITVHTGE
jgi:multidrug resistance efflux pump